MATPISTDHNGKNSADIATSEALFRRRLAENSTDMGMVRDSNLNDIMMRIQAGNANGLYSGYFAGIRVQDADGENVTPEEKEAKERRRYEQIASALTLNDSTIVTQQMYDDFLRFNQNQLQELQQKRTDTVRQIEDGERSLRAKDREIEDTRREMEEARKPVIEAERAHVAAIASHDRIQERLGRLTRIRNAGGATDNEGNEYTPAQAGPDGSPRFVRRDRNGNETIVDRAGPISGQQLDQKVEATAAARDAATTTVTQTAEELARIKEIYGEFHENRTERLEQLEKQREAIAQGLEQSRRSLESIDREITNTQRTITYLEDPETKRRLAAGELTTADLQKNSSAIAWNKFRHEHAEYKLAEAPMNEREQDIFNNILERMAQNPTAAVATGISEGTSAISTLVANLPDTLSSFAAQTVASAASVDGQGIQANVGLKNAFTSASSDVPSQTPAAPQVAMDPAIIVQQQQRMAMSPGGM